MAGKGGYRREDRIVVLQEGVHAGTELVEFGAALGETVRDPCGSPRVSQPALQQRMSFEAADVEEELSETVSAIRCEVAHLEIVDALDAGRTDRDGSQGSCSAADHGFGLGVGPPGCRCR